MPVHKNDIADGLAKKHGIGRDAARAIVNEFLIGIIDEVSGEGSMTIQGFGTMKAVVAPPVDITIQQGDRAGQRVKARPQVRVYFSPATYFKDRIREKKSCKRKSKTSTADTSSP